MSARRDRCLRAGKAPARKPGGARRRLKLMANGSLRRQACNQSGPAGSFPTRNRSLPNATAGHQISKVVRRSRWRERPAEEGPSNLGRRPTAHLEEVESPKRWPIQSTMMTALTSSQ